jgi:hypothetical protein
MTCYNHEGRAQSPQFICVLTTEFVSIKIYFSSLKLCLLCKTSNMSYLVNVNLIVNCAQYTFKVKNSNSVTVIKRTEVKMGGHTA